MISRKSISFKLFAITTIFLIVFISASMLLQILLFDQFYINRKTAILKANLESLKEDYRENAVEPDQFTFLADQYQGSNNTDIVVLREANGATGAEIQWGISSNVNSFTVTSDIRVEPQPRDNNISITITDDAVQSNEENEAGIRTETYGIAQEDNRSTDIAKASPETYVVSISSKNSAFEKAAEYWSTTISTEWQNRKSEDIIYTYHYTDPDFKTKYIILIAPLSFENNREDVIFSISPMQPINEAGEIIKEFYVYVYIAAVILIILLSMIYSNMVSKPLIKLNHSAGKMLNMDFSEKCEVKTDDELGNLSKTLNFLSEKLGLTLADFKRANEQLTKDIEKERSLERMRKEFIAGVSHELKTPLSLVSGYAESLSDHVVSDDMKDYYLDVIMDETAKMDTLINDMLDLSQIESGQYKLTLTCFNFYSLVLATTRKYNKSIEEKNITLDISIDNQEVEVCADALRIEQVLTNFLTNALRSTSIGGGIRINIITTDASVLLQFENTGEKISDEALERIWDRFYKIDKSRNRQSGGIGLGLAIVKNILLLHQSRFGVENIEGGVRFYFDLPKKI